MSMYHFLMRPSAIIGQQKRYLWSYVCQAFNRVDYNRLKEVGPDRMCTEWILKNGGGVRFQKNPHILHTNYNSLPPENQKISVLEVDGTKSTIMSIGFDHLKGCDFIRKIILDNCKYLDDEGMAKLSHLDKSLQEVTIDRCRNISRSGMIDLANNLPHLKRLQVGTDMPLLKDLDNLLPELKTLMPGCTITTQ